MIQVEGMIYWEVNTSIGTKRGDINNFELTMAVQEYEIQKMMVQQNRNAIVLTSQ